MNRYCLYHPAGDSSDKEIPSNGDLSSQKPGGKKMTHFIFKETALTQENNCAA
jgi:hypothetical protein